MLSRFSRLLFSLLADKNLVLSKKKPHQQRKVKRVLQRGEAIVIFPPSYTTKGKGHKLDFIRNSFSSLVHQDFQRSFYIWQLLNRKCQQDLWSEQAKFIQLVFLSFSMLLWTFFHCLEIGERYYLLILYLNSYLITCVHLIRYSNVWVGHFTPKNGWKFGQSFTCHFATWWNENVRLAE